MRFFMVITLFAFITSCSSQQCQFIALAGQDQTVTYHNGIEGITSQTAMRITCLPSAKFVPAPTFSSLKKKKLLEFEVQVVNRSQQTITIDPKNIRVFDTENRRLEVVNHEAFEKLARREFFWYEISNTLNSLSNAFREKDESIRAIVDRQIESKERNDKIDYEEKLSLIEDSYLKIQSVFPYASYVGSFVVKPKKPGTDLVRIEISIPEMHKTESFTFRLSAN